MKISSLPFYNLLSPYGRDLLLQNLTPFSSEKGQILHEAEDGSYGMIFVEEGTLSVSLQRGATLRRLHKGDVCFLSASEALPGIDFHVTVTSETDTRVQTLSDEYVALLLKREAEFSRFVYASLVRDLSETAKRFDAVLFRSVEARLAEFLLLEIRRTGKKTVLLTHAEIAAHIGSAREVVTRTLKRFSAEELVSLGRGELTVTNPNGLMKKAR